MINEQSKAIAKKASVELVEIRPQPGERFGAWWTVVSAGSGDSFWFWGNKAIPSGTVVKMTGGPLFVLDEMHLRPLE